MLKRMEGRQINVLCCDLSLVWQPFNPILISKKLSEQLYVSFIIAQYIPTALAIAHCSFAFHPFLEYDNKKSSSCVMPLLFVLAKVHAQNRGPSRHIRD